MQKIEGRNVGDKEKEIQKIKKRHVKDRERKKVGNSEKECRIQREGMRATEERKVKSGQRESEIQSVLYIYCKCRNVRVM